MLSEKIKIANSFSGPSSASLRWHREMSKMFATSFLLLLKFELARSTNEQRINRTEKWSKITLFFSPLIHKREMQVSHKLQLNRF